MEDFKIIAAEEKDLGAVIRIQKETMPRAFNFIEWRRLWVHSRESFFVALDKNNVVVGYAVGQIGRANTKNYDEGHIMSIALTKTVQGKGLGQELFEVLVKYFNSKNVSNYVLDVRELNQQAIKFYKKNGFHIDRVVKDYYENHDNGFIMRK